jgi:TolA-binding protein
MRFRKSKLYLLFSLLLFLPSCSLWDNFTTYFNLYYNTTDLFQQAEESIKEQKKDLFSAEEIVVPGTANQLLVKVIEKCSNILQFHPDGPYVDDALLMLGKSFYYQKDYLKANRKFQELIATQPKSDLILETKLWIAKTEMRLRNYDDALQTLSEVRDEAVSEDRQDIIKDAFVEEIVYRIGKEDYQVAIGLANQMIKSSKDESIKAEAYYEIGKLYNLVDQPQDAITSFNQVFDYSPSYEIEVATRLELGRTLRTTGEYQKALDIFEKMRNENKYNDVYDQVDLEIGATLISLNKLDEALDKLRYVDSVYVNTKTSGIARYKLGELYQNNFQNLDSAATYYQKASTSQLPPEYLAKANEKTNIFKKYQNLTSLVSTYNSELFYVENPDEFTKDSIKFVQDSASYVNDSLKIIAELNLYTEHLEGLASFDTKTDTTSSDSTKIDSTKIDSTKIDSTAIIDSLNNVLGRDRPNISRQPLNNGNRRGNIVEGVNIDSLFAEQWGKDRVFPKKPLKSTLSVDSLNSLLAKNKLDLGNLFLTELDLPDSAYKNYISVLNDYPNSSLHATALYALGSYYLTVNQETTADSLFNIIYDNYKNESIVNAAANKLNKPLIDLEYDPAKDLYADAEKEMLNKNYDSSINKFYNLYKTYPQSKLAAKALYASGWILENDLNLYDSAAVMYDTLSAHYPQSEYAMKVKPELSTYELFKEEKEKAAEDSLKAIEQQEFVADSLAAADSLKKIQQTSEAGKNLPGENISAGTDNTQVEQSDSLHQGILNDPRRNPRRR